MASTRRGEEIVWQSGIYRDPRDNEPIELYIVAGRPGEARLSRCYGPGTWGTWAEIHLPTEALDALAEAWLAYRARP